MKKKMFTVLAIGFFLAAWAVTAEASFTISHSGSTDPYSEGFGLWPWYYGNSTVGPVFNDMGHDAWSITGLTQNQYAYFAGPLSPSQQNDIVNQGFVLSVMERVQQGVAPVYTPSNPVVIGVVAVSTGVKRFDIDLGVNNNGDTVVVLPDLVGYSGSLFVTPGASYTLTGLGSSYHTYQLVYHPTSELADLFVDGIMRIQNYAGAIYNPEAESDSRSQYSLLWGGLSGGQANFNSVQLTSSPVPIPGAVWLLGCGIAGLVGTRLRRKK